MVSNHCPVAAGIGQCHDESNGTSRLLCQSRPFELARPKLRLEIGKRGFDFDLNDLHRDV
jgi:hypothetical protein